MISEQLDQNLEKELLKRGWSPNWLEFINHQLTLWQEEWDIDEFESREIKCQRTNGDYLIFEFRKDEGDDTFYFYDVRD